MIAFRLSLVTMIFAYGVAVGALKVFPYRPLRIGVDAVREVGANWKTDLGLRPVWFLEPSRYAGSGVTRNIEGRTQPGLTLLAGFFDGSNEVRLIRADGSTVLRRPVKFKTIFPRPSHVHPPAAVPRSEWNAELHDALALRDGSVIFNLEGMGLVKLDRCGDVVWTVSRMVHHAISPADDGGFWVGSRNYVEGRSPYPHIRTPFYDETVMKVSADGEVTMEISVLAALLRDSPGAFYGNATFGVPNGDMIHVNDVEPLPAAIAERFPMFSPGDLLISLRGLSLLMVVNPSTQKVVWTSVGPWIRQHDPDFLPDGHISVFSNNSLEAGEALAGDHDPLGASTIIDFDPGTGASRIRYGGTKAQPMYTAFRGKHEVLDNGNVLIVESNAGRVLEATQSGDVVWEFINRFDEHDAAVVYVARRYAEDYFTVGDWTCSTSSP